jgi:hypothetical protein
VATTLATDWQRSGNITVQRTTDYGLRTTGPEKSPAAKRLGWRQEFSLPAKNPGADIL